MPGTKVIDGTVWKRLGLGHSLLTPALYST